MLKNLQKNLAILLISAGSIIILTATTLAKTQMDPKRLPLGKRDYIVNGDDRFGPVQIQKREENSQTDRQIGVKLRDPAKPGDPPRTVAAEKKIKTQVEYKTVKDVAKPQRLRFAKMPVSGSNVEPRVRFERNTLPTGRVDEPVRMEFLQKVSDAAKDW